MKIVHRKTKDENVVQITTTDERWYYDSTKDRYAPSSTWISSYYPKGIAFYKWLAQKGWDEAEELKISAGIRGSKIHRAIEFFEEHGEIEINYHALNPDTGHDEELTVEEWEAIMSFHNWYKSVNPKLVSSEQIVWNDKYNYAGTLDRIYSIDNQLWVVDFKTGQNIWTEQEIQISSYKHCLKNPENYGLALLQLGFKRNKRGWMWTEVEDKFDLFLHAYAIWGNENPNAKPKQKDYPTKLTL